MCAIVGIVNLDGRPVDPSLLETMNTSVRHRGPDDEGGVLIVPPTSEALRYSGIDSPPEIGHKHPPMRGASPHDGASIGLAHRRFSIIDLSPSGHQPMFDADRVCCIVFNGEIYNYLEIRAMLEQLGHRFVSSSDTEAILEAYKAWGTDCFSRLNGVWSLALYDFREHRLLLSRDRVGKLPLYWARIGTTIWFASEIKALLQVPALRRERRVNEVAAYAYLQQGLRDVADSTMFEGIYTFPSASFAVVDDAFPSNSRSFWSLPSRRNREADVSVAEATSVIRHTLLDAVRIRLRCDVPLGLELSGGLDSSVVVACAAQSSAGAVTAYTVRFEDPTINEVPFAEPVARHYHLDHRIIDVPPIGFWQEVLAFTFLQEEPYHSPNLHTIQALHRTMRADGYKVLLTGAAGDELFAGYTGYFTSHLLELMIHGNLQQVSRNAAHYSEERSGWRAAVDLQARLLQLLKQAAIARLRSVGLAPRLHPYIRTKKRGDFVDFATLTARLRSDFEHTKIPYWLRSGDKTNMGIPIEARSPFLDYRMVELGYTLPTTYLIRDGWHKWILRKAFEHDLPAEVVWRRKKMGFPFPFQQFLRDSRDILQLISSRSRNPHVDLRSSPELFLDWNLTSFVLWYELFFNDNVELFRTIEQRVSTAESTIVTSHLPAEYRGAWVTTPPVVSHQPSGLVP